MRHSAGIDRTAGGVKRKMRENEKCGKTILPPCGRRALGNKALGTAGLAMLAGRGRKWPGIAEMVAQMVGTKWLQRGAEMVGMGNVAGKQWQQWLAAMVRRKTNGGNGLPQLFEMALYARSRGT